MVVDSLVSCGKFGWGFSGNEQQQQLFCPASPASTSTSLPVPLPRWTNSGWGSAFVSAPSLSFKNLFVSSQEEGGRVSPSLLLGSGTGGTCEYLQVSNPSSISHGDRGVVTLPFPFFCPGRENGRRRRSVFPGQGKT